MEWDDYGTGKTTRLIEAAIDLLADLPESQRVVVTGAHSQWVHQLERDFRASGLVGVVFLSPEQIVNGALRGMKGRLLVDDPWDLPAKLSDVLYLEKRILERGS